MPAKLLRPNVGIYVAHANLFPNGITGTSAITLDQVTAAATFSGSTLTAGVVNISPAITDDYTLGLTDSQSDNSLAIVDNANVVTPTYNNYSASIDGFRDASLVASSVYNDFKKLFQTADVKYYLIKRIGKAHDAAFAVGDIVSIFGVTTDFGQDLYSDGGMIRLGARFLTTGEVATNVSITAGTAGAGPTLQATVGTKAMSNGRIRAWWVPAGTLTNTEALLFSTGPKIADFSKTTTVELTEAIAWDSFALGATDSNKIDDRSIIDTGAVQNRGFAQFDAALNFFRGTKSTTNVNGTGAAAQKVVTTASDVSAQLEVGMFVYAATAGLIPAGTRIASISGASVTLTANITGAGLSATALTFYTAYSLAYDTFKASTGSSKPNGYMIVRTNVPVGTAVGTGDEVNVFKFVADATMDNTAGEDSIKFMVNFMPQGLMSVAKTVQA
jgi:hypothetical protein